MDDLGALSVDEVNDARREAFRAHLKAQGVTVAELERRSGVKYTTVHSYLKGPTKRLNRPTEERLAAALDTSVEVLFGEARIAVAAVWGLMGGRGMALRESKPLYEVDLPPLVPASGGYHAWEVTEDYQMGPAQPGWLLVFQETIEPLIDLLGAVGCFELVDGRFAFRRLRKGLRPLRYDLEAWDGTRMIEDVEIVSAMRFVAMIPPTERRLAEAV